MLGIPTNTVHSRLRLAKLRRRRLPSGPRSRSSRSCSPASARRPPTSDAVARVAVRGQVAAVAALRTAWASWPRARRWGPRARCSPCSRSSWGPARSPPRSRMDPLERSSAEVARVDVGRASPRGSRRALAGASRHAERAATRCEARRPSSAPRAASYAPRPRAVPPAPAAAAARGAVRMWRRILHDARRRKPGIAERAAHCIEAAVADGARHLAGRAIGSGQQQHRGAQPHGRAWRHGTRRRTARTCGSDRSGRGRAGAATGRSARRSA